MTLQELNDQISSHLITINNLENQEQAQFRLIIQPDEDPQFDINNQLTPAYTLINTVHLCHEREQLLTTRNQIYDACIVMQACLVPMQRYNDHLALVYGMHLRGKYERRLSSMEWEINTYLSLNGNRGGGVRVGGDWRLLEAAELAALRDKFATALNSLYQTEIFTNEDGPAPLSLNTAELFFNQ
ncbi:MAG: hypothetical protein J3R72DRAFT_491088 [Linnemannia gamsii]|nr:MAG: hypothetical protein J3R72DRAFT_491088 [Linnemannia gamsii]